MKNSLNFSDKAIALILVKKVYESGVINAETYRAVMEKYDDKEEERDDNKR